MTWLIGDLRAVLPAPWSEMALALVAIVAGSIVGIERELHEKPAGLRTLMLICLGSAVFTMVSVSAVLGRNEPGRVAAQIVTGVGFLGAGAILRRNDGHHGVVGLTTAATIWVTAAIGIAIGAGYAGAGMALAIVVPLSLAVLDRVEKRLGKPDSPSPPAPS